MLSLKKVISFSILTGFVFALSCYQSCRPMRHCILLNKINMLPFSYTTGLPMQAMDSVPAKKFSINIDLETQELDCKAESNMAFIPAAYATTIQLNYLYYDTVSSISISALQDFDSTHPAGSPLNDYFEVPAVFTASETFQKNYAFQLHSVPDSSMLYQFRVIVALRSGALYDTLLPPVKITL